MRKVIHIDMDCFYAAVETKFQPSLAGKPVAVGGPPNSRGVLCTANYEARKYGVRAAMPSSQAARLCPQLIFVEPHFERYKAESQKVMSILRRFSNVIEPLSLDEAYIDVTDSQHFHGSATLIAQEIRRLIYLETGLTASAGVSVNKSLAKIASDMNKPNGCFTITPEMIPRLMPEMKVKKLFGIGPVTVKKLEAIGVSTCRDLLSASLSALKPIFGNKLGEILMLAEGVDERPVVADWTRKSLSVEETLEKNLGDFDDVAKKAQIIYESFLLRLQENKSESDVIKSAFVKLKYHDFKAKSREASIATVPTLNDFLILFNKLWQSRNDEVRLIGLGVRFVENQSVDQLQLSLLGS